MANKVLITRSSPDEVMMDDDRIEELADEIAAEVSCNLRGFGIECVETVEDALHITFSWEKQPFYLEVTITPWAHDSDESVKAEIRRQLRAADVQLSSGQFH